MGKSKKYYAVARGYKPGIYTAWFGLNGAETQIRGYKGARYKGFPSLAEAKKWLQNPIYTRASTGTEHTHPTIDATGVKPGKIIVYTDGACRGNPGPGGYGAVIINGENQVELSKGFHMTTNNRMEMMACIAALETLKTPADVILHSDSRYVVNGISKGWARRWRANNWMRTKTEAAENADLWAHLLDLCDKRRIQFVWVRGHAGHLENERCDDLATRAADGNDLNDDHAYVQGRTKASDGLFNNKNA